MEGRTMERTTMEGQRLLQELASAETRLAVAAARLHKAEAEALVGTHYDDMQFDALVQVYCGARREAEAARDAWRRWRQALAAAGDQPLEVTPKLLFARWLYQHGYIAG
jgi:hypothetical protein